MKKLWLIAAGVLMLSGSMAVAEEQGTPCKVGLVPGVEAPQTSYVTGLDFGLLATKTQKIEGLQAAIFYAATTEKSAGVQVAIVNKSVDFDGVKYGFVNIVDNMRGYSDGLVNLSNTFAGVQSGLFTKSRSMRGVQFGFVNVCDDMGGMQVGLVNYTRLMRGLQIGLVNIITESKLPVMIVANARF